MSTIARSNRIHCKTEYGILKRVLVVQPSFMKIAEVINETQKHYAERNIDIPLALRQHEDFVKLMREHGAEVDEISADPDLPEQVFTRDIAFVIHNELHVSSLREHVRIQETNHLIQWLQDQSIPYQGNFPSSIEGGDVLVHNQIVWLGISGRTSLESSEHLQQRLPDHQVIPLMLRKDILHLDCVFNILDEKTALVYSPAFTEEGLDHIHSHFEIIPVTEEEQFYMGPNVLSIGDKKVISLSKNERLNARMEAAGFHILPLDFSEIIKSGGSFRCCTLPLERG
ncbi:hypothetical protein EQV77_16120 [Halobacillus fulvus]|nr:hypothetical protein EQV77_16120 [Halobacillus fulvus]